MVNGKLVLMILIILLTYKMQRKECLEILLIQLDSKKVKVKTKINIINLQYQVLNLHYLLNKKNNL